MIDRLIKWVAFIVLLVFVLTAIFYQRPEVNSEKRAPYLPAEDFVANVRMGEQLFQQHCSQCHGTELQGSDSGPPLIHAYYRPQHHGDVSVYLAVYQGVIQHHWQFGDMPAQKQLNPEQAGHLLAYIRAEQKKAGLF